jgi:hypothetical protein
MDALVRASAAAWVRVTKAMALVGVPALALALARVSVAAWGAAWMVAWVRVLAALGKVYSGGSGVWLAPAYWGMRRHVRGR